MLGASALQFRADSISRLLYGRVETRLILRPHRRERQVRAAYLSAS
jgi:hypothetical protein